MQSQILTVNSVSGFSTDFRAAASQLSDLVNQAILEGWRPLGGVAVGETQSLKEPYLFQAITHE